MLMFANFAAFQVGWLAAVLGAANGIPWAGPVVIALVIAFHLGAAHKPIKELQLVLIAGLIGAVTDSLLVAAGWVQYPAGQLAANTAPYWIVAMWMLFATTLNVSLGWLKPRKPAAAALGLAGGPMAYWAGERLGGIEFVNPTAALVALAVLWAVAVPVLLLLAERYDGFPAQGEAGGALDARQANEATQ